MDSDRRSGIDRRKQTRFNMRTLVGDGNRMIIRRKQDREPIYLVDHFSTMLFVPIIAILFLCAIDGLLTLYTLNHGAYEKNPIMAYFLSIGPFTFFISKYALTIFATLGMLVVRCVVIRKLNITTHSLLYLVAWIYAAIVAWELYLVYKVI